MHGKSVFDGIMYFDNEPSGMCNGECPPTSKANLYETTSLYDGSLQSHIWYTSYSNQDEVSTYKLPFIPLINRNLDFQTLSLNGTHPQSGLTQYDTHSLMGHMQVKRTNEIMLNESTSQSPDARPFILSSSTFAGSGKYGQHFSIVARNQTWANMRYSIASLLNFNMFGIPMSA